MVANEGRPSSQLKSPSSSQLKRSLTSKMTLMTPIRHRSEVLIRNSGSQFLCLFLECSQSELLDQSF